MFGLFKKKKAPEGPVEFDATIDVAASAETFFRLLDFSDPKNAKRELGHSVVASGEDSFELVMAFLPDVIFPLTEVQSQPHSHYSYRSVVPEGFGRLLHTREIYDIEARGADSCEVTMRVVAEFAPGMSMDEYAHEVATLSLSCNNALGKLKIHAEGGIEEVRAFEEMQAQ